MTHSAENDAATLAAIRALHHVEYDSDREETWGINGKCAECRQSYPCPTIRVIPPGKTRDTP